MIREFSAGGIVFKKTQKGEVLWLVAQHSQHKGWVFPKGFIGDKIKNESRVDTALREVEEETGVVGKIIKELDKPVGYFYVWKGEKRYKTVYYYLMKFIKGDIKKHDFEMSAVEWWTENQVKKEMTYKSDKLAFEKALEIFGQLAEKVSVA
jgi:8-oxo-dGTP pyrophosphatase MutT (NUDIX family)